MAAFANSGVVWDSITKNGKFEDFNLQVARGQITNHSSVNILAYGTTPATAGLFRTIWENMATTDYVFPASALTMQLVSTAAGDTATITINGLDANYNIITENVALNGTTNVPTVNQYLRVNSIFVSIGSSTNPTGVITLSNGGVVYAQISTVTIGGSTTSTGISQAAIYTVPAGYSLYGMRYSAYSSFNGNSANYTTYRAVTNTNLGVQRVVVQTPFNTNYEIVRQIPFFYAEKTDLRFQIASSAASAAVTGANIGFMLIANASSF